MPSSRLRHYAALARGCLLLFVFMIFVMFLKKFTLARSVLLLFLILTFTLVMLKDEALQLFRRSSMGKTQFQRRVIIASSGSEIGHIHKTLSELGSHDFEIVGNYDLNNAKEDTLLDMLHDLSANIVLIDSKYDQFSEVEKMIQRCELEGVDVWVLANFFRPSSARLRSICSRAVRFWFSGRRLISRCRLLASRCSIMSARFCCCSCFRRCCY